MKIEREFSRFESQVGVPAESSVQPAARQPGTINGAESLVHTLIANGIDTCFANPGTSEMHFVAALDRILGVKCVLSLFEGVATGAADGYARVTGSPGVTLLHCGPGLANGLANLHNARRARVPILNIVGDHASYHRQFDPPLASDVEGWARPVSVWTRTVTSSESVGSDAAEGIAAARRSNGIATLILPSDVSWGSGGVPAERLTISPPSSVPLSTVKAVANVLSSGEPTMLLIGGAGLEIAALLAAHCIAAKTGAKLLAPTFNRRIQRGRGRHPIELLPYNIDQAIAALCGIRHLILVGAPEPAGFFAYPGKPSLLKPNGSMVHVLAQPEEDVVGALEMLANELAAPPVRPPLTKSPEAGCGAVTAAAVAQTIAALIPEQAIIVDESISFGFGFYAGTANAAPHDWLQLTGGAIGSGLPLATGAAIGAPGRRVLNLQADGSALYTIQTLWTQAREKLDITTIILSNRKYAVLERELVSAGAGFGRTALNLFDLSNPTMDWIRLANAMGVEAARAETVERLADLLSVGNRRPGPFLIELVIP
jgi:acetolactate synthase I/II/III large subunit